MESLESYRFPGCSLLLIFDGAAWERLDERNVNEDNVEDLTRWLNVDNLVSIKMVDFAKGKTFLSSGLILVSRISFFGFPDQPKFSRKPED